MLLDPKRLIDRSIADLTQLSAVATIGNLIPRLQVARNVPIAAMTMNRCPTCED
jgi:hypothetical protein